MPSCFTCSKVYDKLRPGSSCIPCQRKIKEVGQDGDPTPCASCSEEYLFLSGLPHRGGIQCWGCVEDTENEPPAKLVLSHQEGNVDHVL